MDYLSSHEKLLENEISIYNDILKEQKQLEFLSKLDKYTQTLENRIPEKITATVKTSESLGKNGKITLPIKIKGKMLGVGRHKERFYSAAELRKSVEKHKGKIIPLKLDHRDKEVASTIGGVDRLIWDEKGQVVRYEAHINDETHARNVIDQVTTDVSATIFSILVFDEELGFVGLDPEYSEISFVDDGAFEGNTLEVVKA